MARFMAGASDEAHFPAPTLPEVAFLGRSNVGKSSVINSLVGTKVARTSSTPGRTQAINFFELRWAGRPRPELIFADLPGYGYARVPKAVAGRWAEFIDPYLLERQTLRLCLALVDISVPAQASDRELIEFLASAGRPFLVVATKSDRLSNNQLKNAIDAYKHGQPEFALLPYSARTGTGKDVLWQRILQCVEAAA